MRGSRNFRQGGGGGRGWGPGQYDKKSSDVFFVLFFSVLSLFYRSQMVNFKKNHNFSMFLGCPPVRGDTPRALASGLSYVQVDKHGITILYHLHQCRPCTSSDISC